MGRRTLEVVMNHIFVGDYPCLQYPHFQPPKKGGSERSALVIRTPYPPPSSP
jgi:hypothetical protein